MVKIQCRKCKKDILEGSKFCNFCGAKQEYDRSAKKRGNGQGTVYKDKNGKWIAEYTIGWDAPDGVLHRKKRKKRGFATKNEAIAYLPNLKQEIPQTDKAIKFKDLYKKWMDIHSKKVGKSTINCYKAAYKYFSSLFYVEFAKIGVEHLQKCIDECPCGKRTKENMKALGTSLYDYAVYQLKIVDRNYAKYIYVAPEETKKRISFSSDQLQKMWENIDYVPDLKYVLILCYTGMRLNEMLGALTENYNREDHYFVTGIKTDAGKDRIITISPKILPFFDDFGKGKYLFFDGDKKVTEKNFRGKIYYSALDAIGLDALDDEGEHIYAPHSCRHTFATLMKNVKAPATDKQKLIGHAKFEMTAHYTHTDIESLKNITDNL